MKSIFSYIFKKSEQIKVSDKVFQISTMAHGPDGDDYWGRLQGKQLGLYRWTRIWKVVGGKRENIR